ncbi:MAG: hypothetical protein H2174_00350 [Vampirovibrio sp.]|nr:hypothetical protein [Vampirovibrio sp.]
MNFLNFLKTDKGKIEYKAFLEKLKKDNKQILGSDGKKLSNYFTPKKIDLARVLPILSFRQW